MAASLVAVAMMSVGTTACTPAQQTEVSGFLASLITWILFTSVYGDPLPTQPPAPALP